MLGGPSESLELLEAGLVLSLGVHELPGSLVDWHQLLEHLMFNTRNHASIDTALGLGALVICIHGPVN